MALIVESTCSCILNQPVSYGVQNPPGPDPAYTHGLICIKYAMTYIMPAKVIFDQITIAVTNANIRVVIENVIIGISGIIADTLVLSRKTISVSRINITDFLNALSITDFRAMSFV